MTFFCLESLLLSKDLVPVLMVWGPMQVHFPYPPVSISGKLRLSFSLSRVTGAEGNGEK